MPYPRLDLTGQRFGLLTAVRSSRKQGRRTVWFCYCDCGQSVLVRTVLLRRKVRPVKSCGCLVVQRIKQANTTHGHKLQKASRTYSSWQAMLTRCRNPRAKDYPRYGGRGIHVCRRWLRFENFLADMGIRPQGKSIDRFPDRNGNYERSNCRWATPRQQARNRRRRIRKTVK